MKKKKRIRSIRAIGAQIFLFAFILWAVVVYGTTIAVAQVVYSSFLQQQQQFSHNAARLLRETYEDEAWLADVKSRPGGLSALMQMTIGDTRWVRYGIVPPDNWHSGEIFGRPRVSLFYGQSRIGVLRNTGYEFQTAVLFTDTEGSILAGSDGFVHLFYIPQDEWLALRGVRGEENAAHEEENDAVAGRAQFDLGMVERAAGASLPAYRGGRSWRMLDVPVIRIAGFLEGNYIHPIRLCYVSRESYNQSFDIAFDSARRGELFTDYYEVEEDSETFWAPPVSALDHAGFLEWQTMLDATDGVENPEGLVTVYGLWPWLDVYDTGEPVTVGSHDYDSLLSFLRGQVREPYSLHNFYPLDIGDRSLRRITVAHSQSFTDYAGHDPVSGEVPEPDFIMLTAIHGNPLRYAISTLTLFYYVVTIIVLFGANMMFRAIKRNLTQPLEAVNG